DDRADGAARRRVEDRLPAGVDDDLVVAVLLGVDQQRGALKRAGAEYLRLAVAPGGGDADRRVGDPQHGRLTVGSADVLAHRARWWPTGPAPGLRDGGWREDDTQRGHRDGEGRNRLAKRHFQPNLGTIWLASWMSSACRC